MPHRTLFLIVVLLSFGLSVALLPLDIGSVHPPDDFTSVDSYVTHAMQQYNITGLGLAITKHVLWVAFTILNITIIAPAFLKRSFSFRWFSGFLPNVAIIVTTLIWDDVIQIAYKVWTIMHRSSTPRFLLAGKYYADSSIQCLGNISEK